MKLEWIWTITNYYCKVLLGQNNNTKIGATGLWCARACENAARAQRRMRRHQQIKMPCLPATASLQAARARVESKQGSFPWTQPFLSYSCRFSYGARGLSRETSVPITTPQSQFDIAVELN